MDERFEWLELPDEPAPAPAQRIEVTAPTVEDSPVVVRTLAELGVDMPERRLDVVPGGSSWAVEPYAFYKLRLLAEQLSLASGFDRLVCLDATRIERLEHQHDTALKVLRDMRGRALLADEVGLGKTIEAGLVMKELIVRGLVQRVLILVPASLTRQWQEELEEKFGERFTIVRKPEDWDGPRLVASLDLAKQPRHSAYALATRYDMLIVDEAHKLKARNTLAHQFVNKLARRYVLLLTATPVQNSLDELYNLVTILQPGQLGTARGFFDQHVEAGDPRLPRNPEALRRRLGEVMVRNRRSSVGLNLPPRRAGIYHLSLPPDERKLYDGLTDFIHEELELDPEQKHLRLVLSTLQRELCSSPQAIAGTLRKLAADPQRDPVTRRILGEYLELAESIGVSRKARAVGELLERLEPGEQVLVFTEFRATQDHLVQYLTSLGHETVAFHGGLDPGAKEAAVRRFQDGARILVSTESGAEGRNLQFCHVLINHDLPWNPMRVEQRIGRLHRLGQQHPVTIFNLSGNDTIEAELVELLAVKIRMFELVVGELDMILGDMEAQQGFEEMLQAAWLRAGRDRGALHAEFEAIGRQVTGARGRYHEAKAVADTLVDDGRLTRA
jgi:SNF2 family DNA or RNA helicase